MSNRAIPPPVPPPRRDMTGSTPLSDSRPLFVTDVHEAETAPKNGRAPLVALIVTIIGMTAAAVVWAAREHDSIKDWTAGRDYATKQEVVEIVEKHYVPTDQFIEVKTKQTAIKEKVDDIDEKVNEIHDLLIRGERPKTNGRDESRNDD